MEEISTWSGHALISNLGGLISLWTGASALPLIQAVLYFVRWIASRHKSAGAEEKKEDLDEECVISHL